MSSKVIVITGASGGIGAALARKLGGAGHAVVLAARRQKELEEAARASGAKALAVPCDVTRRAEVEALKARAIEAFGKVDVWINNAGRGLTRSVLDLTDADLDEMIAVNVKSALYGMQAIVPHFLERGEGHLLNVSSFLGRVPIAAVRSAYSASKAALNSLTTNLRMDLARTYPNVHVTLVMPGIVLTDFAKNALHGTPGFTPPTTGPMAGQSVDACADAIAGVIERPAPELYTNPAQAEVARSFYANPGGFQSPLAR
jgi:short-subunit dehydrogenase